MTDGRSAASNKGMPALRIVPEEIPCECNDQALAESGVRAVLAQIVEALTQPLSADESAPKTKEPDKPTRIAFQGQLEEVNRFFYKRGWGDGLPLVPPTEEAVAAMLAGTDLPPEHVVAKIEPRNGKATVERIAVNAVMAGALPTHLPILIACVEAVTDPQAHLGAYGASTGSWMPFWIVNGPVRNDVQVNCGSGALSPGNIANAVIGRAMGLIIKNIGGIRKGVEDMGVFGNPGKYSCVVGENEEMSPWQPLHVDQGLEAGDSAVSLFFPNCYSQIWQYGSDDKGLLNSVIYNLPPGRGGLTCVMVTPSQARVLAQRGWTKPMIRRFVYEYGRVPAYRHPSFHTGGGWTGRSPETVPPGASDHVPVVPNPDFVNVVVTGGPGAFIGIACGGGLPGARFATKKVKLPAAWPKLVAKYRSYVPAYEKY